MITSNKPVFGVVSAHTYDVENPLKQRYCNVMCFQCLNLENGKKKVCRGTSFPTRLHVCPAKTKTRISKRIRTVWSEYSQGPLWIAKDPKRLQSDSEDSDQTVWMHAGRKYNLLGNAVARLSCFTDHVHFSQMSNYIVWEKKENIFFSSSSSCWIWPDAAQMYIMNEFVWSTCSYGKLPKISNTKLSDTMAYANSSDLDQTAPEDQGLYCLPSH